MLGEYLQQIRARIADILSPQIRRLRIQTDPYVARARASYEKLGNRERRLVQIAGALLGVFLVYNLIYAPITDFVDGFDERIATREHELASAQRLAATYSERKADLNAAQHNTVPDTKDFSLFSVVEASFSKSVGHDKIGSITPSADKKLGDGLVQYSVQLKLNGVSLAQLVDALYAVRTLSVPVGVANLRIERRTQDTRSYDVDITCVALGRNA
ncbi:MAG: type II secretion system protein GspM [Candidatus Binataceae bacterium]